VPRHQKYFRIPLQQQKKNKICKITKLLRIEKSSEFTSGRTSAVELELSRFERFSFRESITLKSPQRL
jgi:hypothetical protein